MRLILDGLVLSIHHGCRMSLWTYANISNAVPTPVFSGLLSCTFCDLVLIAVSEQIRDGNSVYSNAIIYLPHLIP
ncbi:hypothetical protein AA0119_g8250 [Alternaria tenuissima]|uniref:Uncharacterized protein n=1 Tax=Alternaria tenuissima TaxID=119927 RepID=A0A4Q4P9K6_9PLEO|nr:hypothetical protein AA0114_g6622 [Alternaria tenuissima]RYN63586.1 hypothetical protein AA0118_g4645 [Alternaria tenuissima]RYN95889.1 hypothetical protein AA0119_g8250 [Alternaria tenuissima]RYO58926.1 hypothetical protein AA0116_g6911 [Alternaria tenuissima]